MIATIDIRVNAAHPNIPLAPLYAFEGSPSNVRILNVPQRVGRWQIDAVSVTIALPDNSSTTVPAVAVCGYWVATLPSCDETGYCAAGLQIMASGTDENGNAVTGYCLGVGDVTILSRDATAVSNGTRYYLHYVAEQPGHPNPGDMCYIDGVLKWYDGTAWQTFAAGGSSVDVVPPSTDPADAGKAADAKATGDALAGKVPYFTSWTIMRNYIDITAQVGQPWWNTDYGGWDISACYIDGEGGTDFATGGEDATEISWSEQGAIGVYVAVRRASIPAASDAIPQMDGTGSAGSSAAFARGDHVHPKDTSKQDAISDLAAIRSGAAAGATAVQPDALAGAVRYDILSSQPITSASTDSTDPQNPINYGSATLADRASNGLEISADIDELRLTFPAKVSVKVRDFGLRVVVDNSQGSADIADIALPEPTPTGTETLSFETSDGEMPKIKGAAAGATATTILYFTEIAESVFLVKGEEVKEVS